MGYSKVLYNCSGTPHPTPPQPTPAFPFNVMAFPFNVMAFPVTGRSHGLALGTKKVALDLGQTFQHLTVNWNFNVLEMAVKNIHFVQGLSRTPLLFIPRYLTNIFFKIMFPQKNSIIENLKIWNFKNPGSLTGAQLGYPCDCLVEVRPARFAEIAKSRHTGICTQGLPHAKRMWSHHTMCPITFCWALVSEPGFLKFQIFRFPILEIILFFENMFEK